MADDPTQQSSPEAPAAEAPEAPPAEETSGASTPDDVEAYWRKRISNSDKAHAAEKKVLDEQLASLRTASAAEAGNAKSEADSQALRDLQQRLTQSEARATAAELKAKYPNAVESVGAAAVHMDEASLASLNERLNFDASVPPRINDKNNPARPAPGAPKAMADKTTEELMADLKSMPSPWSE